MSEPLHVAERGPFYVSLRNAEKYVEIFSEDLSHQATLTVTGFFESTAQRIAYAEEIVRRLNSFNLHGSPLREG